MNNNNAVAHGRQIAERLNAEARAKAAAAPLSTDPLLQAEGWAEGIPLPPEPANDTTHSATNPLAGMMDADTLDRTHYEPLQWIVPNVVPEGLTMLVAPPKAGKSWMVAGLGIACASGGVAFGKIRVDRRPVLYLALEDGWRRLQARFRQINPVPYQPKSLDLIIDAVGQVDVELKMAAWLHRHSGEAGLVILDTLGRIKPPKQPGEESYLADYAVGVRLKTVIDRAPGSSLLVVHHTRKAAADDFVDGVSGTQGLAGSFDSVLVLARRRQATDAVLHVTGRDVPEAEYGLQTDRGLWTLIGDDLEAAAAAAKATRNAAKLSDRSLEVLAFVGRRPETRAADLEAIGIDKQQAYVYLNRLADAGHITKTGRGLYTAVESVMSVMSDVSPQVAPTSTDTGKLTLITDITPPSGGVCRDCGDRPPRCPHCHATHERVMARYDQ